jgi:hypothetical protein
MQTKLVILLFIVVVVMSVLAEPEAEQDGDQSSVLYLELVSDTM